MTVISARSSLFARLGHRYGDERQEAETVNEPKLTDEVELELLAEKVTWLEQTIADVDRDIASAIRSHAEGERPGEDGLADIQKHYQAKCDLMFELGQTSVYLDQTLERIEEQRARSLEDQQQADTMAVLENHLDWLEVDVQRTAPAPDDRGWQEPERDRS
jgi:hypothetical protein